MKVKFVLQMEIDDAFAIDDDTGEKLGSEDLLACLKESLSEGDFAIELDEIKEITVLE